jgi:HlyD family secretion protein
MMDRLKRWRWAILIAALLLLGLGFAFWPEAVAVDAGKVTRGAMQVGITDDGVTRAEEYYVVSAPVTGYLSRIELEPGDPVARGALITRMQGTPATPLDDRTRGELRAALAAAGAAEASAASSLSQSRRDLERAEELSGRGFLPKAQLEAARTRVATGRAALEQARAEAQRARAALSGGSGSPSGEAVAVRAPAGGSVLSVISESEGVIAQGTPLVTIGDPHRIEAVVDLLSREAAKVRPGDRVVISQWGGSEPLSGRVDRVEPFGKLKISALGIEEQRVNVIISFDPMTPNEAARLGHGYQIDATIVLWSRKDALRVPLGALFRGAGGGWLVFVIEGRRARLREVKVGHIDDEFGEVLAGLAAGDVVVLNPSNSLENGNRVRIN